MSQVENNNRGNRSSSSSSIGSDNNRKNNSYNGCVSIEIKSNTRSSSIKKTVDNIILKDCSNKEEDDNDNNTFQESYDSLEGLENLIDSSGEEWMDEPLEVDTNNSNSSNIKSKVGNLRRSWIVQKTASFKNKKKQQQQQQEEEPQQQPLMQSEGIHMPHSALSVSAPKKEKKSNDNEECQTTSAKTVSTYQDELLHQQEQQHNKQQRQLQEQRDIESQEAKGGSPSHQPAGGNTIGAGGDNATYNNTNANNNNPYEDLSDDSSMDFNDLRSIPWPQHQQHRSAPTTSPLGSPDKLDSSRHEQPLSLEDIELCQELEKEYEMALEEREIGYTARFDSVRQSACFSVGFMIMILLFGTIFFVKQADWSVPDSLLFSIYTITTVGYGNLNMPQTPGFQLYTIFYIFVGIATLTIMVAQVYQCLALEASRAQHSRDKSFLSRRGIERLQNRASEKGDSTETSARMPNENYTCWDHFLQFVENAKIFFQTNEIGRGLSVVFPFAGLIVVGAVIVGPIEGWTVIESVYYAVVSLTTVGYGDYQPTHPASIWFAIFWLPFSVGFMSMFLGNVASFYIRLSDRNISRIELRMRRRIEYAKQKAQKEYQEAKKRAYAGQLRPKLGVITERLNSSRDFDLTDKSHGDDHSNGNEHAKAASGNLPKIGEEHAGVTISATGSSTTTSATPPKLGNVASMRRRFSTQKNPFEVLPLNEQEELNSTTTQSHSVNKRDSSRSFGSSRTFNGETRRQRIRRMSMSRSMNRRNLMDNNSSQSSSLHIEGPFESPQQGGQTMETMKDIILRVKNSRNNAELGSEGFSSVRVGSRRNDEFQTDVGLSSSEFLKRNNSVFSMPLTSNHKTMQKASFSVRVLVQERFAQIIAYDIAGFQSAIEIKENTLSVTIDTMRQTADKWCIPRRARKAFRAVAFEALYFIGEHALITRGADALFDLTPIEFHSLFSPLVAAMGDAETMEGWLDATKVLAEVDLKGDNDEIVEDDDNLDPSFSESQNFNSSFLSFRRFNPSRQQKVQIVEDRNSDDQNNINMDQNGDSQNINLEDHSLNESGSEESVIELSESFSLEHKNDFVPPDKRKKVKNLKESSFRSISSHHSKNSHESFLSGYSHGSGMTSVDDDGNQKKRRKKKRDRRAQMKEQRANSFYKENPPVSLGMVSPGSALKGFTNSSHRVLKEDVARSSGY